MSNHTVDCANCGEDLRASRCTCSWKSCMDYKEAFKKGKLTKVHLKEFIKESKKWK